MMNLREAYVCGMISERVNNFDGFPTNADIEEMVKDIAEHNDLVAEILKQTSVDKIVTAWWFLEDEIGGRKCQE